MTDQQRREVTAQARRCIKSSWEECQEAVKLETRVLSNNEHQQLKEHLAAACPEIQSSGRN